jgi:hypothetical protein
MQNAVFVSGRLVGPRNIQLDEPVADLHAQVVVIVRTENAQKLKDQNLAEFFRGLPSGTRNRGDIDEELKSERAGWEKGE